MPMRNGFVLLAALALLVAGVAFAAGWGADAPEDVDVSAGSDAAEHAPAGEAGESRPSSRGSLAVEARRAAARGGATRPPEPVAMPDGTRSKMAVVRGRCVAAESGEPIDGCSLTLRFLSPAATRIAAPTAATGGDGRFELGAPASADFVVTVSTDDRGTSELRLRLLKPEQTVELGDLRLRPCRPLRGRVVD